MAAIETKTNTFFVRRRQKCHLCINVFSNGYSGLLFLSCNQYAVNFYSEREPARPPSSFKNVNVPTLSEASQIFTHTHKIPYRAFNQLPSYLLNYVPTLLLIYSLSFILTFSLSLSPPIRRLYLSPLALSSISVSVSHYRFFSVSFIPLLRLSSPSRPHALCIVLFFYKNFAAKTNYAHGKQYRNERFFFFVFICEARSSSMRSTGYIRTAVPG